MFRIYIRQQEDADPFVRAIYQEHPNGDVTEIPKEKWVPKQIVIDGPVSEIVLRTHSLVRGGIAAALVQTQVGPGKYWRCLALADHVRVIVEDEITGEVYRFWETGAGIGIRVEVGVSFTFAEVSRF